MPCGAVAAALLVPEQTVQPAAMQWLSVSTQVDRASPAARTQTAAESTPQAPSPSLAAVSTGIDGHARKGIEPAPCLISADAPCAVLAHSGIEVPARCCYQQTEYGPSAACSTELLA